MIVHFEKRLAFLEHPKTASRATAKFLREQLGFVQVTDHHQGFFGRKTNPMISARKQWEEIDPTEIIFFATVRNHWDTLASWFIDFRTNIRTDRFDAEWLDRFSEMNPFIHGNPEDFWVKPGQLWHFAWGPWVEDGRFVELRYENLEEHLRALVLGWGFDPVPVELEIIGKTLDRARDYREHFTEEGRELIATRYAEEIERFGYSFDGGNDGRP